ncbi:MAG: hypothetical protein JNM62_04590 [Flavobacteriales bacterium]|nr:hypothetical protein [Flavobacteriales bacterium]
MNKAASLLLLLSASPVLAQPGVLPYDAKVDLDPGYRNTVSLKGLFDYNANTVLNELPLALYRGGHVGRDLRQRSAEALREKGNSVGYVIEGSATWTGAACWSQLPGWRPLVSLGYHDLAGSSFTEDAYALTFFGNAAYEGRTAVLGPSAFERTRYETFGGGMIDQRSGSFVQMHLVRGRSFTDLNVEWATLFTGEDGRVLRSALLGDLMASDTSGSGWDRTNGLGAAFSARWAFTTNGERPLRIGLGVDDLGFIAWNGNTVRLDQDTLIRYEGWHVDDLFGLDAVIINEETVLDTLGLRYDHGSATRLMPFRVYADATMDMCERWRLSLAVDHRHLPGYIPQLTALASRTMGQRTMVGANVSYGGFGTLRVGFAAKHRFGQRVLISFSTPQLAGFATGRVRGLGLVFGLHVGL